MTIDRALIGRAVRITWRDANYADGPLAPLLTGRAALATWTEYGVIHDITEGVVLLAHSYSRDIQALEDNHIARTAVPECIIEECMELAPREETTWTRTPVGGKGIWTPGSTKIVP